MVFTNAKKVIALGAVVVFLITAYSTVLTPAKAEESWSPGQGWGYKWAIDFHDYEDQLKERPFVKNVAMNGGFSQMIYMKYIGKDSYGYKFQFKGGMYKKINEIENKENYGGNISEEKYYAEISSDYSGYFWLSEALIPYKPSEDFHYYGVSRMECNASEYMDVDSSRLFLQNSSNSELYDHFEGRGNVILKNFTITFSPSIPLIALNNVSMSHIEFHNGIDTEYSGDRRGYMEIHYMNNWDNSKNDFQGNIDKHISHSENLRYFSVDCDPEGRPQLPVPMLLLPDAIEPSLSSNNTLSDIEVYAFLDSFTYKISYKYNFIYKIYYTSFAIHDYISSSSATEQEVDSYLQNKRAYTPGIQHNENGNSILPILILVIIAVVAILIVFFMIRKRGPRNREPEVYEGNQGKNNMAETDNNGEEHKQ